MPRLTDRDLLQRLLRIDSTSHLGNAPVVDAVCEQLERSDVVIERLPGPDASRCNLVARVGPRHAERGGVTLCGHLDVVPATEPQWTCPPFELTERDGVYLGRGSCDMKGFVALAVNLMLDVRPDELARELCLLLTYDEEVGSLGARDFVQGGGAAEPLPIATVIGEPTSLRVVRMHKGHLKMRITLRGKAAHSGSPHRGVNAIEPAAAVVAGLIDLRQQLENEPVVSSRHFSEVPFAVLNVARIHGGEAINVIPETCVIDLGVRPLPGQAAESLARRVEQVVSSTADAEVQVINDNPPMELAESAPIHRTLQDLVSQTESRGVSFSSDAGHLQRLGHQCVLFGPGSIEVAHRPDEFVPIEEFNRCHTILRELVDRQCRRPEVS